MGLFKNSKKTEITFDQVTTKGGDKGESSTFDGGRGVKYDTVFQVVGDMDELSAHLGKARVALLTQALFPMKQYRMQLRNVQERMINLMGLVNTLPDSDRRGYLKEVDEREIQQLEKWQKELNPYVPSEFIIPGDFRFSVDLEVSRTVCRRAERSLVELIRTKNRYDLHGVQQYMNRLSDYLFMLARKVEQTHDWLDT